jgi:hypothetical protein
MAFTDSKVRTDDRLSSGNGRFRENLRIFLKIIELFSGGKNAGKDGSAGRD